MSRPKPSQLIRRLFASRLALVMGGLTATDLSRELKSKQEVTITYQAIVNYLKGDSLPKSDILYELGKFFGKPMGWFFGEDEPQRRLPKLVIEETRRFQCLDGKHTFSREHYVPIPLLKDAIAAGPPSRVKEDDIGSWAVIYNDREWMPHSPEEYTCVRVKGESMWPVLADGDIVAVDHADRDPASLNNKMVVFRTDEGATVKWLRHIPKYEMVIGEPENRAMSDSTVYLKGEDINDKIVGRVAWWWAKR